MSDNTQPSNPSTPPGGLPSRMQGGMRTVNEPQNWKERVIETLMTAKSIALELVEDFRASDRFFKYKAAVLASWALLSLMTVIIACPSARESKSNSLGAIVRIQQVPALDRSITALLIENTSSDEWGDLFVKINNTYSAAIPGVRAGQKSVIQLDKFTNSDSRTPPPGMQVQVVELRCNEGEATIEVTPGQ